VHPSEVHPQRLPRPLPKTHLEVFTLKCCILKVLQE
jgi:hypothetical protein